MISTACAHVMYILIERSTCTEHGTDRRTCSFATPDPETSPRSTHNVHYSSLKRVFFVHLPLIFGGCQVCATPVGDHACERGNLTVSTIAVTGHASRSVVCLPER